MEGFEDGFQIGGIRLTNLRYADDIVLNIAGSQEEVQELIYRLNLACDEFGRKINCTTTYVMRLNVVGEHKEVFVGKNALQECSQFSYLGCLFETDSNANAELETRLKKAYAKLSQLTSRSWV